MNNETLKLSREIDETKKKNYLKQLFIKYESKYDGHLFKNINSSLVIEAKLIKKILYHLNYSKNKKIKFDFSVIPIDVLGTVYEEYLGQVASEAKKHSKKTPKKKKEGIYYTPSHIVMTIVENTVLKVLEKKGTDSIKILDPACGSGSFLITSLKLLFDFKNKELTYTDKEKLIKNHIFGIDKDSKAVEITKLNLCLSLIAEDSKSKKLPVLSNNISWGNSLTDFEENSPQDKYDVIITNPPYGADFEEDEETSLRELFPEASRGSLESYLLFYILALRHLKEGGYLGFITPDGWLTNINFGKFRSYFASKGVITKIIDVYKPFPHAKDVRCHIVILKKVSNSKLKSELKSDVEIIHVDPHTCREKEPKIKKRYSIKWSYFIKRDENMWYPYQDYQEKTFVNLIDSNSKSALESYDFSYGLRTGKNKKYVTKTKTKIPLIFGDDFEQYLIKNPNRYLKPGRFDGLVQNYQNKEKLVVQYIRTNSLEESAPWLEVMLASEKIVGMNSTNMIFAKMPSSSLKVLLAILNSKMMNKYYKLHYTDVNVKSEYLKLLPFPKNISASQVTKIEELVDRIISNKKTNNITKVNYYSEKLEKQIFNIYKINYKRFSALIAY